MLVQYSIKKIQGILICNFCNFDCAFHIFFYFSMSGMSTVMLLVANLANTKWCTAPEKLLKTWHIGTHLRVLTDALSMEWFKCKPKIWHPNFMTNLRRRLTIYVYVLSYVTFLRDYIYVYVFATYKCFGLYLIYLNPVLMISSNLSGYVINPGWHLFICCA